MGKRKPPAPRGYDPGGFRFPGRTPFFEPRERYEGDLKAAPVVSVGPVNAASTTALGLLAVAAIRRRRG